MKVNNSNGKDNWSQRMNPDDPATPWNETLETCNVTSFITAAVTAGHDVESLNRGYHPRPPVDFLYFMRNDPDCRVLYKKLDPNAVTPMNEYMEVLAMAGGKYLKLPKVLTVQYELRFDDTIRAILRGDGIVIHGQYTFARKDGTMTQGGHFQSVAGMNYRVMKNDDNMEIGGTILTPANVLKLLDTCSYHVVVDAMILDDPFGNPNSNYIDTAGNDIQVSYSQFVAQVKPLNRFGKDVIVIPKKTA